LNILVVGTGNYVSGRGTLGYGTILPAIYEWRRKGWNGQLSIAGSRTAGLDALTGKVRELNALYGADLQPKYFPESHDDDHAYEKAVDAVPRPACAIVAVPDHLHSQVTRATIAGGLHTLVVKPLAATVAEVAGLVEAQAASGTYCAVELHKRLDRSNIKLRDALASGRLGDPLYFVVEYSQRKSVPSEQFRGWADKVNPFQYLGVHYVDIICQATGAAPVRASALGQKNWLLSRGIDTHDAVQAVVEWKMPSGPQFTSSILTNWIDPESTSAMSDQRIKVIGTHGRFEADQKNRGIRVVTDAQSIEEPNPDFCSMYGHESGGVSFQGYGIDSILQFLSDAEGVDSGEVSVADLESRRPTFRSQVVPTAVIEAVNQSLAADGEWVKIGVHV
jgi:predicted dehydrogenase